MKKINEKKKLYATNFLENKYGVDFLFFGKNVQPWHILKEDVYIIYEKMKMDVLSSVERIQKSINYLPESSHKTFNEVVQYSGYMTEIVKKETLSEIKQNPEKFKNMLSEYGTGNKIKDRIIFEGMFRKKCLDTMLIEPIKHDMKLTGDDFSKIQTHLMEYTRKRNSLVNFCQKITNSGD